jgi:hypothetical protein
MQLQIGQPMAAKVQVSEGAKYPGYSDDDRH